MLVNSATEREQKMNAAEQRTNAAAIYRNVITYHRNQIRFYCHLARITPALRPHMLARARQEAQEIKETLTDWRLSYPSAS